MIAESHSDYTPAKAEANFELLIRYYRSRIEYHCNELAWLSRRTNPKRKGGSKSQKKRILEFEAFRTLYLSYRDKGLNTARLTTLANAAYRLTGSSELEPALRRLFEVGQAAKVLRQLRFTARIRAIFLSLTDCIRFVPNFGQIKFVIVPSHDPRCATGSRIVSAREASLAALQEFRHSVPEWMGNRSSAALFESDFCKQSLIVHAEVQLACFFDTNKEFDPFDYLGISKKPCHLCGIFLSEMRVFRTRPGHGQLHPYWTLPIDMQMRKHRLRSPAMALRAIEQHLIEMIGKENVIKLAQLPESTAVWSARMTSSSASPSIISSVLSTRLESRHHIPASPSKPSTALSFSQVHQPTLVAYLPLPTRVEEVADPPDDVPPERTRLRLEFLIGLLKVLVYWEVGLACGADDV